MARRALARGLIVTLLGASILSVWAVPAGAAVRTDCRILVTDFGSTLKIVYLVHSSRAHRRYGVKIVVDGDRIFQHALRTDGDGRLRVRVDIDDEPGREAVVGSAKDLRTGNTCVARVLSPTA